MSKNCDSPIEIGFCGAKGVEDGMGAEHAVRQVYPDAYLRPPIENREDAIWRIKDQPGGMLILGRGPSESGAWAEARSKLSAAPPEDKPTFAYSLAMFLTRNGQQGNAPEMQADIEQFMRDREKR